MIFCQDNVFLLKNKEISYLFRIGKYRHPEHLHFGAPVELSDAEALACRPGLGWGCSVLLEDKDSQSCLDFWNHSCSSLVWLTTRSISTFIPRLWAPSRTCRNASMPPNSGEMSM